MRGYSPTSVGLVLELCFGGITFPKQLLRGNFSYRHQPCVGCVIEASGFFSPARLQMVGLRGQRQEELP